MKEHSRELNLTFHDSVESMVKVCDVVTINCPLHPETENLLPLNPVEANKRTTLSIACALVRS